MFEKAKIHTPNVWKSQKPEFQCLERRNFRIPMFVKGKNQNSNLSGRPRLGML